MEFINLYSKQYKVGDGVIYINETKMSGEDQLFQEIGFGFVMFLFIAGIIVNLFLVIAIRRSSRLSAPIFQLLLAIAIADTILVTAFALPEIGDYFSHGKWLFGDKGCTVLVFLRFLPAHVNSCLIVVCCWERFYAVCRPHSALWITQRIMSGIIAITFLLNAGVLAPLIPLTKSVLLKYEDGTEAQSCQLQMAPHIMKLYFTVMGMLFYGISAILSLVFLACTICKLKKVDLESYFIKDDFKNHILRCIAVITGIYILLWIPHYYAHFFNLHSKDGVHADSAVIILGVILVLVSGVIKPLLYISVSSQFRKAVVRGLSCCRKNKIDYHQTHGYKMHDHQLNYVDYKFNDRQMLAELEPL